MPSRHSIRLRGYDYSQNGYYFVTICTKEKMYLFGDISGGVMVLNDTGTILHDEFVIASKRFGYKNDVIQIMPNHVHFIWTYVGAIHESPLQKRSRLSQAVGFLKANVSKKRGLRLWQRNYYERIIRDEREYWAIRRYIADNPKNWAKDTEYVGK